MKKFKQENETTEFKAILNEKMENVVISFLNSKVGGDLYIGVSDDGSVLGVNNPDKTQLTIMERIKNNILPTCLGFFDVFTEVYDKKTIIHVVVSRGTEKPYYLRKLGMSPAGCFVRVGSASQQMPLSMIDSLYAARTRNSLRNIPSPRNLKHTFAQLKIYYQEQGFNPTDEFLQNLDLYTAENKLNYVGYLLADVNSISIKVAKYSGKDKCDLIENEEYGFCSLAKATQRVLDKLDIENRTFTKITGNAKRLERKMIDKIALREAMINAIVHNDYSQEVTPVVEIFSNRLEITSYGGLVQGLSEKEFFGGRSMPRNRELMRVFRDLELVEHLGSGMQRILKVYSKNVFSISDNFLQVIFPFEDDYLKTLKTNEYVTHQDNYIDNELDNEKRIQVTPQVSEQVSEQVALQDNTTDNELNNEKRIQVIPPVDEQVTPQVKKLVWVLEGEMTRSEIQVKLRLSDKKNYIQNYQNHALTNGYIEMTIPDKPNSRLQKYRLTEKGHKLKKSIVIVK